MKKKEAWVERVILIDRKDTMLKECAGTHVEFDKFVRDEVVPGAVLARRCEDQRTDSASVVIVSIDHWRHIISLHAS